MRHLDRICLLLAAVAEWAVRGLFGDPTGGHVEID